MQIHNSRHILGALTSSFLEHMSSPPEFCRFSVTQSPAFWGMFYGWIIFCLFVPFLLAIVLSVLQFTVSDPLRAKSHRCEGSKGISGDPSAGRQRRHQRRPFGGMAAKASAESHRRDSSESISGEPSSNFSYRWSTLLNIIDLKDSDCATWMFPTSCVH